MLRDRYAFQLLGITILIEPQRMLRRTGIAIVSLAGATWYMARLTDTPLTIGLFAISSVVATLGWPLVVLSHEFAHACVARRMSVFIYVSMREGGMRTLPLFKEQLEPLNHLQRILIAAAGPIQTALTIAVLWLASRWISGQPLKTVLQAAVVSTAFLWIIGFFLADGRIILRNILPLLRTRS